MNKKFILWLNDNLTKIGITLAVIVFFGLFGKPIQFILSAGGTRKSFVSEMSGLLAVVAGYIIAGLGIIAIVACVIYIALLIIRQPK